MFRKAASLIAVLIGIAVAVAPAPNTSLAVPDGMTPEKLVQMGTSLSPEAYQAMKEQLAAEGKTSSTLPPAPVAGGADAVTDCYPLNANYETGSCLTTSRTQTSLVYGSNQSTYTTDRGWWVFDVTSIPDGSDVTAVQLHAYCIGQYWPYWAITRVTATDPRTGSLSAVYADLDYGSNNGESPTYYYSSTSNAASGWNTFNLGTYACSDLEGRLAGNWFPVGLTDWDNYYYYWIAFQGWNESNKPYITVTYIPPMTNDIGVMSILAPVDPYYAFGDTIYPRAIIKNFGTVAQNNVPIRCKIRDSVSTAVVYEQVVVVPSIAPLTIDTVDFPLWAAPPVEAIYRDSMRAENPGDMDPSNDVKFGRVKYTQWGAECITYNDGTFDNAISWVSAGNELAERFFAPTKPLGINKTVLWLSSFSGVDYAAEVRIYGGGTPGQNQLGAWVGNLHSSIWTSLYKNEIMFDPAIEVNYDTFFVSYYQTSISPAYPYLGMDYTPPVTTQNDWGKYNGTWGTFPYDGYMDFGLDACYQAPLLDGKVVSIQIPAPVEDSNVSFTPQVTIQNAGLKSRSNMPVVFDIIDSLGVIVYSDTVNSGAIAMGATKVIDFNDSYAPHPGNFTDSAYTLVEFDGKPENDMFVQPLFVRHLDVITQIVSPRMQEVPGLVPVSIRLINNGNVPAMVPRLDVKIMPSGYSAYLENIAIGVGENQVVTLGPWVCPAGGHETATAYITYAGDMYPPNDTAIRPITTGIPGWTELTVLPAPPSGKFVKDGGNLTYDEGTDLIYASKGNKTGDFYAYSVPLGTWTNKLGIPLGAEGKPPYKGSVACADGAGKLYLTKGNNTVGFWEYDAAANTWTQKTNIPLGSSGKKVKQGAGLAWAGSAKVGHEVAYLLKGYRNEFHRYDPATNSWVQLLDAPIGTASHVKWDAGSWLVADPEPGAHLLYAFKSKYHEFYTYDTDADTWSHAKAAMPIPGSAGNKKAKDGSCGAWYSGKIYAFKGGNTTEFWRYFPLGDSWHKQDDIPLVGTSGSRKKVKAGGSLAGYPGTGIYAFKGNKSNEFWRYTPYEVAAGAQPSRDGVTAGSSVIGGVSFAIAPNPLSGGLATVRYSLPKAGLATLNVFDVAGRTVLSQTMAAGRTGTASLDLRKLEAGVYLVKVTTEGFSTTQKLVVEH